MSWQEGYVARYEAQLAEKWTQDGQRISDRPMMRYDGKLGAWSPSEVVVVEMGGMVNLPELAGTKIVMLDVKDQQG